jgi:hypothetical protein
MSIHNQNECVKYKSAGRQIYFIIKAAVDENKKLNGVDLRECGAEQLAVRIDR